MDRQALLIDARIYEPVAAWQMIFVVKCVGGTIRCDRMGEKRMNADCCVPYTAI